MFTVIVSKIDTTGSEWKRIEDVERGSHSDYSIAEAHRFTIVGEYRIRGWKFDYIEAINAFVSENRDGKIIVIGIRDPLK